MENGQPPAHGGDARPATRDAAPRLLADGQFAVGVSAGIERVARAVLDVIDGANDVIENGVRLAVYAQAREEGISQAQAASIAKNISVNFNRKGNDTAAYNALYMFFNANVQGNVRMIQGVMSSRRAQVYAGALTLAGAAVALLNW